MKGVCGLLLPGMTLNSSIFPDLPFTTISVDFNRAPPPFTDRGDLMAGYVAALRRRLESSGEWRDADSRIVVAHSFGGMVAQRWIIEDGATTKVDRLLLVATTAGPMYDVVRMRVGTVGGRELRIGIGGLMRVWNSSAVTWTVKRVMTGGTLAVQPVDFRTLSEPTDLKIDFAGWRNTDWRAMRAYRAAMDGFDVRRHLSHLSMPTIVIHGTDDALFPPEVGEALARGLPNAALRLVEGAHHVLPLTHPDTVREAALELVES